VVYYTTPYSSKITVIKMFLKLLQRASQFQQLVHHHTQLLYEARKLTGMECYISLNPQQSLCLLDDKDDFLKFP
jgi:hypothetical protein